MRGQSLTQFIIHEQRKSPGASGDFTLLLSDIATACKAIAHEVHRGPLAGTLGLSGSENVQGEAQKKLDIIANDIFVHSLEWTGHLAAMASEENDEIIQIPSGYPRGKYLIAFDPLDGSSNIDLNLSVGTIFSVMRWRNDSAARQPSEADFLQPGTQQVCAGFCIYGPTTIMVLTTGNGVNGFTLDGDVGEFILTHPNMRIPAETSEFAINMSNRRYWDAAVRQYVDECVAGDEGVRGKNFNMRWIASMVAEVYRILTRGGVFLYPRDHRPSGQSGRLRLLYEANPMSFIIEQAGGLSSAGPDRIMDLRPESLHQRVPVMLGAKSEIQRLAEYHMQQQPALS
ncbi:MAG: class 1 fructose-bisphosphatase [Methylotetracoccus sp.]